MKFQITDDPNYVNREEICKQRMAEKRIELEPKIINDLLNCIQAKIDNKHYKVEKRIFEQTVRLGIQMPISGSEMNDMGFNSYSLDKDIEWYSYKSEIIKKVIAKINAKYPSWKISWVGPHLYITCKRKEFEF